MEPEIEIRDGDGYSGFTVRRCNYNIHYNLGPDGDRSVTGNTGLWTYYRALAHLVTLLGVVIISQQGWQMRFSKCKVSADCMNVPSLQLVFASCGETLSMIEPHLCK